MPSVGGGDTDLPLARLLVRSEPASCGQTLGIGGGGEHISGGGKPSAGPKFGSQERDVSSGDGLTRLAQQSNHRLNNVPRTDVMDGAVALHEFDSQIGAEGYRR